mgnify:FL=1
MIYAGEEIGERGMDHEGFSGVDGRTSIFDWWAPSSLTKIYKFIHGDKSALTETERKLLAKYRTALTFATKDQAVRQGNTYDLALIPI